MASLTLRLVKGSPLTNTEMDNNLSALNTEKVERNGTVPMTGKLVLVAPAADKANARLIPSAVEPTGADLFAGDLWNNQGTLKFRTGFTGSGTGTVNLVTTGDAGTVTDTMLASGISTSKLSANSVTITAGTGLSGGGTVALGASITLNNTGIVDVAAGTGIGVTGTTTKTVTNTGVTSLAAGTGISVNAGTGAVTVTNSGVVGLTAGTGITVSAGTGTVTVTNNDRGSQQNIFKNVVVGAATLAADSNNDTLTLVAGTGITITGTEGTDTVTFSLPQAVATNSNVQFGGIGVGTSPVTGEIRATGEVTAYASSDMRLKENIVPITDAISKVKMLSGVEYDWKESALVARGGVDGYFVRRHDVGLIAQQVEKVLPQLVVTKEDGFKAVRYDKMVALLIEAVKDLQKQVDELKAR